MPKKPTKKKTPSKKVTPEVRDKTGRFRKGVSGNPGGMPAGLPEFRQSCRAMSGEVLTLMMEIVRDTQARNSDRIKAGGVVLAYGFGNPSQPIEFAKDDDGKAQTMEIVFHVDGQRRTVYNATVKDEGE